MKGRIMEFWLLELLGPLGFQWGGLCIICSRLTKKLMGSEPALILGHSPSPNLMPSLSSPHDIIPNIILGPFLFPVQFLKPHQISCSVFYEFIQGKEKKSTLTQVQEPNLLEGTKAGQGTKGRKCSKDPCRFRSRDHEDRHRPPSTTQEEREGFSHFSL